MTYEITNQQLYQYENELKNLQNGSVLSILLKGRIGDFYSNNGIRIQTLMENIREIQKRFMEIDEHGNPIWDGEGAIAEDGRYPEYY